jgi:hypothetical protein
LPRGFRPRSIAELEGAGAEDESRNEGHADGQPAPLGETASGALLAIVGRDGQGRVLLSGTVSPLSFERARGHAPV